MNTLLIIAHGSRHVGAREELEQLTVRVGELTADRIAKVQLAFLEFIQPDIPTALTDCVNAGAERIFVLPYFLNAGVHVQKHIPEEIATARQRFPDTLFELLPHFGAHEALPQLIAWLIDS